MKLVYTFFLLAVIVSWSCKKNTPSKNLKPKPVIALHADLVQASPLLYAFTVTTQNNSVSYQYSWDFGDGTTKKGTASEQHSFAENKNFRVSVTVSYSGSDTAMAAVNINTSIISLSADTGKTFQTMEGFGGFGAQDVYWSAGPFTSASFVNDLINDLGLTILRDNIPLDFEIVNDNSDPYVTDLSKYHINGQTPGYNQPLGAHLQYLSDMKAAGLTKLITSIWSPMAWMKTNNNISNGTNQNSAPPYNPNPTSADNQLRTDMYEEFAEMCVAYIKIIKQQTGLDVYALSIQNEPRFSQSYESCVYDGAALRDLLKIVGDRLRSEGLATKLFLPEDVGYLDGVHSMIQPALDDSVSRKYVDIVAVHGYAFDGITAASPDAQTWQTMYSWGAQYGKPLWMTETSGFSNDFNGAMDLSKAMYTAIKFGNVSAWLFWALSQSNIDAYSLMSSSGAKSKRYYVSKNFYRYIRPGSIRFSIDAADDSGVHVVAFKNNMANTKTIVLINDNASDSKLIQLPAEIAPSGFNIYLTSAEKNCENVGTVDAGQPFMLPVGTVMTLVSK